MIVWRKTLMHTSHRQLLEESCCRNTFCGHAGICRPCCQDCCGCHPVASLRCGGHSGKTWAVGANLPPAVVCQHRIYAETVYHEHTDARGRAAVVGISRRKGKGCGIQVRLRRDKPVLEGIQEMERVRPVGIPQAKTDRGKRGLGAPA